MKLFVLAALLPMVVLGNRYCKQTSDCEDLGAELECIKSLCDWGICGCQRGFATKFVGSEFKCAPLRKLGESCDTSGSEGVCAALNSRCDPADRICVCDKGQTNLEERWGGQACIAWSTDLYPSESYSTNGIGSCVAASGQTVTGKSGNAWSPAVPDANPGAVEVANFLWDYAPNVCACGTGYKTVLPNSFNVAAYMGGKKPMCAPIVVGDACVNNNDCQNIGDVNGNNGKCTNNVCECHSSNHVNDITGTVCGPALSAGTTCAWSNIGIWQNGDQSVGVCDGTQGLRCGDVCSETDWITSNFNATCVCDASWVDNSGSCSKATVGSTCFGDANCKSLNLAAICVEGACQNGAAIMVISLLSMLCPILAMLLQ